MDQILSDLKNPAWWFSAFLFAIIVNVIGGFLKDQVGNYLSRYSDHIRTRRAANIRRRKAVVESLSSDGAYLNAALTRSWAAVVVSAIFMIAYLLYLQTAQIKLALCDIKPVLDSCSSLNRLSSTLSTGFLGLFSAGFNYKVTTRLMLVKEGLKAYRTKHNLPPLV